MLFTNLDQSNAISLCKCHQRIFHSIFSDPNCEKVEKFKCTKRRSPKKQSQWTTYWDWNGKMKMGNAANEMRRYKWLKIVYYRCDWLKIANETNKKRLTNYIQISTNGLTTIQLTWKRTHEYSCDSSVVNLLGNCPALYQNEFQPKHKFLLVSFFSISFEVNFWKKALIIHTETQRLPILLSENECIERNNNEIKTKTKTKERQFGNHLKPCIFIVQ